MTELEIKQEEYIKIFKDVIETLADNNLIKKQAKTYIQVTLESYANKGKELSDEIEKIKEERIKTPETIGIPLKILKELMFKYMASDYQLNKADYKLIIKAVHILEDEEKFQMVREITPEEILKKYPTENRTSMLSVLFKERHLRVDHVIEAMKEYALALPKELLEEFRMACLKYPIEPAEVCFELAKGWYELRDTKLGDPLTEPLKL